MLSKRDSGTVSAGGGVSPPPSGGASGLGANSSASAENPPPNGGSVTSPSGVAPAAVEPETLPYSLSILSNIPVF